MKTKLHIPVIAAFLVSSIFSCRTDDIGILNPGDYKDTQGSLKSASDVMIGMAIEQNYFLTDAAYKNIVLQEAKSVTFGNEMKHYAIVKDDGSLDFTKADQLYAAAEAAGLEVFGHTLGWHSNQNANFLKRFTGVTTPAATELATNPGFESGLSGWSIFNTGNPSGSATVSAGSGASEVRTSSGSMKVVNPTAYPGSQWRVQVSSAAFATTVGKQYEISYWVKAASAGGSLRLSTGPSSPQYQADQTIGTGWQQVIWTITASLSSTTFIFDMGQAANTYYIDDVSVKEVVLAPSGGQIATKVDETLKTFVTGMVTHYKGKVKAWDVVNELFTENGSIRNNSNSPVPKTNGVDATDWFVWSHYLGKDFGLKAFQYAAAADPNALLFINDYNLESSRAKVDSLVKYVTDMRAKGAKIDGIGTQMHISINTSYAGIDYMFEKLVSTGLKIRISELDIRANPTDKPNFDIATSIGAANYQATMYEYVVKSYLKHVPAAQRHGITFWGVSDKDSWIVVWQKKIDAPLLFDKTYAKKPAYSAVLQALK